MNKFLSCDWGTTSFRLRLIEAETLQIIEEESSKQGIAETFKLWKESGKSEESRLIFYLDIISNHIEAIRERSGVSLDDLPLIISGMASSTIGMVDIPYKNVPFSADGSDLKIFIVEASEDFRHKVVIISGIKTEDDVMRGEETKLVGCVSAIKNNENHIYIFPGTHPKHIKVKNGQAIDFKTYMTGEFFELLSKKSILSVSVKEGKDMRAEKNLQSFAKGVKESINSNLLHSCFLVRTNDVFKKLSSEENYFYLSGILIGSELKDVIAQYRNITVVANAALSAQYIAALHIINLFEEGTAVTETDADEALIKGQSTVYKELTLKNK